MDLVLKINDTFNVSANVEDEKTMSYLLSLGYKPIQDDGLPNEYNDETMEFAKHIQEEGGLYYYRYDIQTSKVKIEKKIDTIKQELANTDYKVIKNMEYQSVGIELEYDPQEIYNERQTLRDEINKLQKLL